MQYPFLKFSIALTKAFASNTERYYGSAIINTYSHFFVDVMQRYIAI
jgi:hypothetical protein